ncbi:MAG TPA: ATP-grasp domain-containing protein [Myxococcota bacterium]|nr:ATP-grasp domain-containing protein [Myxococcota bacterium]
MTSEVVLLFGGPTRERLVSVASAQNVAALLESPRCCFWAADGAVFEVPRDELLRHPKPFEQEFAPHRPARWRELKLALDTFSADGLTLFLALHGGIAENGTLQGWLEERRIPFTGSGSAASRDAFDKVRAREIMSAQGVRVAEGRVVEGRDVPRARASLLDLLDRHPRLVLKPVADGSSMGLQFVKDRSEIEPALSRLKDEAQPYLAEAFIGGTELTVGVIDHDDGLRALPCSEIRVQAGTSFGYTAKYLGQGAREITPAEVAPEIAAKAQELGLRAHRALRCFGYSRTDLIVAQDGLVYLETNTLPGLTRASFIPQQLEAAQIPMRSFLARQLALARRRAQA